MRNRSRISISRRRENRDFSADIDHFVNDEAGGMFEMKAIRKFIFAFPLVITLCTMRDLECSKDAIVFLSNTYTCFSNENGSRIVHTTITSPPVTQDADNDKQRDVTAVTCEMANLAHAFERAGKSAKLLLRADHWAANDERRPRNRHCLFKFLNLIGSNAGLSLFHRPYLKLRRHASRSLFPRNAVATVPCTL
jgi:hypothetical protein